MKKNKAIRIFYIIKMFLTISAALYSNGMLYGQKDTSQIKRIMEPYVTFLEKQNVSAKDYVLNLFKTYDLVILCERDHRDMVQYDLITDIIRDERFIKNVGNVYCELGASSLNPELNEFLHTPGLSDEEVKQKVMYFHRNMQPILLWDKYNYSYFLSTLYSINKNLTKNKLNLYPLNIPIDWKTANENTIKNIAMLQPVHKDSVMASQFGFIYDEKVKKLGKGKGLIIMNYRHAFNVHLDRMKNFGKYIFDRYPGKVANVYINYLKASPIKETDLYAIQDGKWDAAFRKTEKDNIGFNFSGSPFGADTVDICPLGKPTTYAGLFNGFLYYRPMDNWKLITGVNGFIDDSFSAEFLRRAKMVIIASGKELYLLDDEAALLKKFQDRYNHQKEGTIPNREKIRESIDKWIY